MFIKRFQYFLKKLQKKPLDFQRDHNILKIDSILFFKKEIELIYVFIGIYQLNNY